MLAYSSVAQIGYIIIGFAIGNVYALIGAMFHIVNHALMKSALFLIAGSMKLKYDEITIDKFKDIFKKMPLTMYCFLILAFSMIGIPLTAGFFSKWYLVMGALEKNLWIYIVVIVISSLLNAVYFFRIIEFAFMKEAVTELKAKLKSKLELPMTMLIPIILLSFLVLALGIFNEELVSTVLFYALPEVVN
jgi:multicomponent Na+:H+ antiporter subunit D